ncbi:hypothetical protein GGS26DRAFT_592870 [Hypomontagnella submonticulosa]|nr:hypothetical protein GGS26DRAFT_592870 [Hypomontagnella submonticulosa]
MPPKQANQDLHLEIARTSVIGFKAALAGPNNRVHVGRHWPSATYNKRHLPAGWAQNGNVINSLHTLNTLQAHGEHPVDRTSLHLCLWILHARLPEIVQNHITIDTFKRVYWSSQDNQKWNRYIQADFPRDKPTGMQRTPARYRDFYRRPYNFMAIDMAVGRGGPGGQRGSHWVIVVIVTRKNDPEDNMYTVVKDVAIIDPSADPGQRPRVALLWNRIMDLLENMGLLFLDGFRERIVWVPVSNPPQDMVAANNEERWSTGLRAFDIVRQLFGRITDSYCANPLEPVDDDVLWAPLSGWFNAASVRSDLIGMAGVEAMRDLGFHTRIAIEPVDDWLFGENQLDPSKLEDEDYNIGYMWVPGSSDKNGKPIRWDEAEPDVPGQDEDEVYGPLLPVPSDEEEEEEEEDDGNSGAAMFAQAGRANRFIPDDYFLPVDDFIPEEDLVTIKDYSESERESDAGNERRSDENSEEGSEEETEEGSEEDSEEGSGKGTEDGSDDDEGSDFGESSGLSPPKRKRKSEDDYYMSPAPKKLKF